MKNIVGYCRVSTNKEDQINSIDMQKSFFEQYSKKNDFNLIKIYADEGISGTKLRKRKQFLNLMNDAKSRMFDTVIVKDISRFSRNTVDFLQSIRILKALNIETVFLTSNQTVLGNSEFILTVFSALAQEESANISKRIKFGKKLNAQKGRVPNIVYGYNKISGDYYNLYINEEEAEIIKEIFDLYTEKGYGINKISNMLNERQIYTKRGCEWSQNAVRRILTNKIYIGNIINGKSEVEDFLTGNRKINNISEWIVIDKPELKIIETNQFKKAQIIMKKRENNFCLNKQIYSNKHLFSTLIKCKDCGYSFRRIVRTYKNTYIKWVCSKRNIKGLNSCENEIVLNEIELIDKIENYFDGILKNKKVIINNVLKNFIDIYDNNKYENELKVKINKLNNVRKKYIDLYVDEFINKNELKNKLYKIDEEILYNKGKLNLIEFNDNKKEYFKNIISDIFNDIEKVTSLKNMTNIQLRKIINKIEVSNDGTIDIYLNLFKEIDFYNDVLISDIST